MTTSRGQIKGQNYTIVTPDSVIQKIIAATIKDIDSKIITMPTEIIKDEVIKSTYTVVTSTKSTINDSGFAIPEFLFLIAGTIIIILAPLPLWLKILLLVALILTYYLIMKAKRRNKERKKNDTQKHN